MSTDVAASPASAILGRPIFWVAVVGLLVAVPIVRAVRAPHAEPLPKLGQVPTFSLKDEQGSPFGTDQLKGKVWVANFIFTRCPTACPLFTAKMAAVASKSGGLADRFHLVSLTVDPEYDTPERLKAYGREHRANPRQWSFLSGSQDDLKKLIVDGLRQPMDRGADDDLMSYVHGGYFVLVDTQNEIRGYYGFNDEGATEAVARDAARLSSEG